MFSLGFIVLIRRILLVIYGQKARGTVVGIRKKSHYHNGEKINRTTAIIEYVDHRSMKRRTEDDLVPFYKKEGAIIRVVFNKSKPSKVLVLNAGSLFLAPFVLFLLGAGAHFARIGGF